MAGVILLAGTGTVDGLAVVAVGPVQVALARTAVRVAKVTIVA